MQQYLITVTGEDQFGDPETHYYIEENITDFSKVIESYLKVYEILCLKEVKVKIERILTTKVVAFSYDD